MSCWRGTTARARRGGCTACGRRLRHAATAAAALARGSAVVWYVTVPVPRAEQEQRCEADVPSASATVRKCGDGGSGSPSMGDGGRAVRAEWRVRGVACIASRGHRVQHRRDHEHGEGNRPTHATAFVHGARPLLDSGNSGVPLTWHGSCFGYRTYRRCKIQISASCLGIFEQLQVKFVTHRIFYSKADTQFRFTSDSSFKSRINPIFNNSCTNPKYIYMYGVLPSSTGCAFKSSIPRKKSVRGLG